MGDIEVDTGHGRDAEGRVRLRVDHDPAEVELTETPVGLEVRLPGATVAGTPGEPALPRQRFRVAVPEGMWPGPLRVGEPKRSLLAEEPVLVAAVQPLRPAAGEDDAGHGGDEDDRRRRDDDGSDRGDRDREREGGSGRRRDCCCEPAEPTPPSDDEDRGLPEHFDEPAMVVPDPRRYEEAARDDRVARITRIAYVGRSPIVEIEVRPVQLDEEGRLVLVRHLELEVPWAPRPTEQVDPERLRAVLEEAGVDLDEGVDVERLRPLPEPVLVSPAQARRAAVLARELVLNPVVIDWWQVVLPELDLPAEWLVITDNQRWDADTISPLGPVAGDMVAEFERLATHKRSRGVTARVVTISDIVAGRFGDFRTGSRDLQEVIRRFLKSVHGRWGVAWVLLGGDVAVLPPRVTATALEGHVDVATTNPPEDDRSFWTGSHLRMHVVGPGIWWPGSWDHRLVNPATGRLIPHDPTGATDTGGLGWYWTDATYTTRSTTRTQYVRVNGPAAIVNARLQWLYEWNQVPTDLYYSSLQGWVLGHKEIDLWLLTVRIPYVYEPAHDWDATDNGLYGQFVGGGDVDGVHWQTDVSVGRAPVQSGTEATTFVDKVIAYERYAHGWRPTGSPDWTRGVTIAASNWGGAVRIHSTASSPPGDNRFHASGDVTVIRLADVPGDFERQLVAEISDSDRRELPWNGDAPPGTRGWHYARSATDHSLNAITITLLFGISFTIPMPSRWIVVHGPAAERNPASYLLDHVNPDGSMVDQEALRTQLASDLPGWNRVSRLYEDLTDLTPAQVAAAPVEYLTATRMRDALDAGPHVVSLSGHGSGNGCCGATAGTAQLLTNGPLGFIAYADSCLTNQIDRDDSFGEHLVTNVNGGAVAYVGNTRFSWIGVGDDMQRAFFHRLTTTRHLGLLNDSRVDAMNFSYWHAYARWITFALTLVGDPEMPVWRTEPARILPTIEWDGDLRSPVRVVVPKPPDPPPWFLVRLRQGGLERAVRVAPGEAVSLDVSDAIVGELELTVASGDRDADVVPYVQALHPVGPTWIVGVVTEVSHRDGGGDVTLVDVRTADGSRTVRVAHGDPDHHLVVEAAIASYAADRQVHLLVTADRDGATVLRFRFADEA